jgi:hypothetical protein
MPAGKLQDKAKKKNCILKVIEERSRIASWIRIRIRSRIGIK